MKIIKADSIDDIMKLITSEYSWEQIIYKIIAWEGLDPWDLDIKALSDSFMKYVTKMEQLDFKVPAKYVVIAAVLLRMKSDHLEFLEFLTDLNAEGPGEEIQVDGETTDGINDQEDFQINPITVPPRRKPVRRIMVTELISALRKVMETEERRKVRGIRRRGKIEIKNSNIVNRLEKLHEKINGLLKKLKSAEKKRLSFSELIEKKSRENVVNTFLPLVYLENDKKIRCEQEEMFDEIYISKWK